MARTGLRMLASPLQVYTGSLMGGRGSNQWGNKPFDFTPFEDLRIFDRAMSIVEWLGFFPHYLTPHPCRCSASAASLGAA